MNPFRRTLHWDRRVNVDRESSPTSPTHQAAPPNDLADPTRPSNSPPKSWTTHDSNLALVKCLSTATPTRPAIPTEIILQILEDPTRWIHIHSIYRPPSSELDRPILRTRDKPTGEPVLYTRSLSARDTKLLRKVVFTFRSRDQGWCSNSDDGNWSWFEASLAQIPQDDGVGHSEASLERTLQNDGVGQDRMSDVVVDKDHYNWINAWTRRHPEELEYRPRYKIQSNRLAEMEPEDYTIELTNDHELVRQVKEGDRIILWACACFPGWENLVYEAKISIEGVNDLRMERAQGDQ